jgi:hypothetical protein
MRPVEMGSEELGEENEVADVTYYVGLSFVISDDGPAPRERVQVLRSCASRFFRGAREILARVAFSPTGKPSSRRVQT